MAGNRIFGVDAAKLAQLPSNVRCEVVTALAEADAAMRSGDAKRQAAATENVLKAAETLRQHHGERTVQKFFLESLTPLRGDHATVRKFALRAGVQP